MISHDRSLRETNYEENQINHQRISGYWQDVLGMPALTKNSKFFKNFAEFLDV